MPNDQQETSEVRKFFAASGRPETAPATIGDVVSLVEHLTSAGHIGPVDVASASATTSSAPAKKGRGAKKSS